MRKWASAIGVGLAAGALLATPALGQAQQTDYEAIVRIMRECAKIGELEARAACYDSTIDAERLIAGAAPAPASDPGDDPAPAQVAQPAVQPRAATVEPAAQEAAVRGLGAETVPVTRAASRAVEASDDVELGVTDADRLEPGVYLLTLEDGSQWRFVDAVPLSYDTPRTGSRIELSRAAMGSFQMHYESQRPVRIVRVR